MRTRFFTDAPPQVQVQEVEEEERDICPYALQFETWAIELVREHGTTLVSINQGKVLLVDRYFEWRATVPTAHRNRVNDQGHICIFHVFDEAYRTFRTRELSIRPPIIFIPEPKPPLPPPSPPQIAGIFIGEVDD